MENETIPIQVWARNYEIDRTDYGLEVASKAYVFFENYYQIPYALPKMDLISIPNFNAGGIIHGLRTLLSHKCLKSEQRAAKKIGDFHLKISALWPLFMVIK